MSENQRDRIAKMIMQTPLPRTPLPRPNPYRETVSAPELSLPLNQYSSLESSMGNPALDRMLATPQHLQPRYPSDWRLASPDEEAARSTGPSFRGIAGRANPLAFERAWQSWAPSENVDDRRGVTPDRVWSRTPQQIPDAPGWEWANSRTFRWADPE
jgi:hypothetical protein